jgi:iron complex transport system ATP-binding protein
MTGMELRDLSLTTGGALRVDQVNAHVTPGRLIAVIGANGSGKSSLLSLTAGHLAPTSGQVLLAGQPIGSLAPAERARHLAWLGQSTPGAETFAVRDVVAWGLASQPKSQRATQLDPAEAIARVGLSDLADAPLGSLSGGERQRAHIARVWVQAAPITLLDEPDASLDESGRQLLRGLITQKVNSGHAVVIITHDRQWATNAADELWVMDAGRLTTQ